MEWFINMAHTHTTHRVSCPHAWMSSSSLAIHVHTPSASHNTPSDTSSHTVLWDIPLQTLYIEQARDDHGLVLQQPLRYTPTTHKHSPAALPSSLSFVAAFPPQPYLRPITTKPQLYHPIQKHREHHLQLKKQSTDVTSSITGRVVQMNIKPGDRVQEKQCLMIIEAMKMENKIFSPITGTILTVSMKEGEGVSAGSVICTLAPAPQSSS